MADIAPGLNFRIGADVKNLNKAIREAERSLKGAVSTFSSIGNSLSLALSAPILAFGAASIKAAGDIENLKLALEGTMKDAGRSTADAARELDLLRQAALAPGLDFEQAVRGSVRLQSVGIEAEKARAIIVQLANALALSGGTADQLDSVTKQFTQMIGKGKILQEDISIILENMPALASVMKKEFGATTAEGLNAAGVSVEKFIEKLTTGMEKLPRAAGGISNAITNVMSALQQSLASIGEEINKTFNISGLLNDFGTWVQNLATWFKNLDESTKRVIGAVAVFAVTLGPAFKLMQGGVWIIGQLHLAFLGLQKVLAQGMAGQAIPAIIAKWRALDFAMKASVIGATVAVVLALAAAFVVLQKDMSASAQAARAVEKVRQDAAGSIALERAQIEFLTKVAGDETKSKKDRLLAMDELIKISPTYRGALNGETIDTQKLTAATHALVQSMLNEATAKKAIEGIADIDEQLRNLKDTSDPTWLQTAGNAFLALGNATSFAGNQVKTSIGNYQEQKTVLEAQRASLEKVAMENVHVFSTTEKSSVKTAENTKKVKENTAALKKQAKALEIKGFDLLPTTSPELAPMGLNDAAKNMQMVGATIVTALTPAQAMIKALETDTLSLDETFKILHDSVMENGNAWEKMGFAVAASLEQIANSGGGFKEMAGDILGTLKKLIGGMIKAGVAAVVQGALIKNALLGVWAVPIGIAAGSLAQIAFNSILNKIQPPALAEGGVLTSPQLVMAGEYAGARTNPEIVTPENKMRDVFKDVMRASSNNGVNGQLVAVVRGDDLLFIMEKAQNKAARKR